MNDVWWVYKASVVSLHIKILERSIAALLPIALMRYVRPRARADNIQQQDLDKASALRAKSQHHQVCAMSTPALRKLTRQQSARGYTVKSPFVISQHISP